MSEIENLLNKGQTSLNLNNPKEALSFYQKILDQNPLHLEALLKKGNIFGKFGKFNEAIICYDDVLSQDKENILALLNKGLCYHKIEQYDAAIECFNVVLSKKPQNKTALYNKSSSIMKSGKVKEGLAVLSELIKIDPSYKMQAKCDIDFVEIKLLNEFKDVTS
ncbi:MAG TPA: tetratricopeptide repeat protein [Nitrosopumilus sp.]|jgi:tetratricopeptide (TPR) repeat protein|nr:tetratricopeptide repeat protein [Nitrosopumilus sp.]